MDDSHQKDKPSQAMLDEESRKRLLEHADRCWRSECENASRYDARLRIFVPLASAAIALAIGGVSRPELVLALRSHPIAATFFIICGAVAVALLFLSLWHAVAPRTGEVELVTKWFAAAAIWRMRPSWFWVRRRIFFGLPKPLRRRMIAHIRQRQVSEANVSSDLQFDQEQLDLITTLLPHAESLIWIKVNESAIRLNKRNIERRDRVKTSERWLAYGLVWVGIASIFLMYAAFAGGPNSENTDGRTPNTNLTSRGSGSPSASGYECSGGPESSRARERRVSSEVPSHDDLPSFHPELGRTQDLSW